jgi:hypothetical protein
MYNNEILRLNYTCLSLYTEIYFHSEILWLNSAGVAVVSPCKEDGWFANGGMVENGPIKPATVRSHPDGRE